MRDYGQIQTSYWTDPEIQSCSDQAKLLGAYLLTGQHSTSIGCMRIPDGYVMEDLNWKKETVSKGFRELFRIGFINRDSETGWIVIKKFLFWNPIANPNVAKKVIKEFNAIPKNVSVYSDLIESLKRYGKHFDNGFINRLETVTETLSKPEPNLTEPNQPYPNQDMSSNETVVDEENNITPKQQAIEIIDYLNVRAGRTYEHCETNLDLVIARLKEGRTVEQCFSVIDHKVSEWINDESMYKYLRPATLFNKSKFSQYIGEVGTTKPKSLAKPGSFESITENLKNHSGEGRIIDV